MPAPDPTLWYFGYGSNMDPGTFLGRRKMRPAETRIGVLDGFALVFDLPVGKGERAVANVRQRPGSHVWGVLYRITARDAAHLDRTEGVHRGYYQRVSVAVRPPDAEPLAAYTLHSQRGWPGRKPSRRYLGLLLTGARHHGLPDAYIDWLRGLDLAEDERERQGKLF